MGQELLGLSLDSLSFNIDRIDLNNCSAINIEKIEFDYSSYCQCQNNLDNTHAFFRNFVKTSGEFDYIFSFHKDILFFKDGKLVKEFNTKTIFGNYATIFDFEWMKEENSIIVYGIYSFKVRLPDFEVVEIYSDIQLPFFQNPRPASYEYHECDYYFIGFSPFPPRRSDFVLRSDYLNFSKPQFLYELPADQCSLYTKQLVQWPQNCYKSNLVTYEPDCGWKDINLIDSTRHFLCDTIQYYSDVFFYYNENDPFAEAQGVCNPILDLVNDGCIWANDIDASVVLDCAYGKSFVYDEPVRFYAQKDIDSLTIEIRGSISYTLDMPESEGFAFSERATGYVLKNNGFNNVSIALMLRSMTIERLQGTTAMDPALELIFTPYADGLVGEQSVLSVKFTDTYLPENHYLEAERGAITTLDIFINETEVQYLWDEDSGVSCTTCRVPSIVATEDLSFTVEKMYNNGCTITDSVFIGVVDNQIEVFIPNVIYPSSSIPVNRFFGILGNGIDSYDLTIAHRTGALVYEEKGLSPGQEIGWDGTYRGGIMPQGVYVYFITVHADPLLTGKRNYVGTVTLLE